MAEPAFLASAVLMGLAVVAVAVAVLRMREWRTYTPQVVGGADTDGEFRLPGEGLVNALRGNQTVWYAAFVVLAFGLAALALLVSSGPVSSGAAIVGAVGGLLVLYAVVGAYYMSRGRGHPSSRAIAESVGVLALLLIAAIAVKLVTA